MFAAIILYTLIIITGDTLVEIDGFQSKEACETIKGMTQSHPDYSAYCVPSEELIS